MTQIKTKILGSSKTILSSIFYFKASLNFCKKAGLGGYQTVVLYNSENPEKYFAGYIEYQSNLNTDGLMVSEDVLNHLDLQVGSEVKLVSGKTIPVAAHCELQLLEKTEDGESQKEEDRSARDNFNEIKIKASIKYNPLVSGCILNYENESYRVKLIPTSYKIGYIGTETKITFTKSSLTIFANCVGLEQPLEQIKDIIELPIKYPELYQKLKLKPPKGILLFGPPGCGKTHLVREVAKVTNRAFYACNAPEFTDKYVGESEKRLRSLFEEAKKNAPSIIFIDELDAISAKRDNLGANEFDKRVVGQLLTCLDGMTDRGDVLVIGATNLPDNLDPALRRAGRLDKEVYVRPPNEEQRVRLLKFLLKEAPIEIDLEHWGRKLNGYTPADMILFCQETKKNAILEHLNLNKEGVEKEKIVIKNSSAEKTYKALRPSSLRGYFGSEQEDLTLEDIAGYEEVKQEIRKEVILPILYPSLYDENKVGLPKGLLLHGPPGTGKTTLAKAVAKSLGYNLILLSASELLKGVIGESQRQLRTLFSRARATAPTMIVLDEIESVFSNNTSKDGNSGLTGAILSEMDGIRSNDNVIIVGTTNRKEKLSSAILRPGRFDLQLKIDYPTEECLEKIFRHKASKLNFEDLNYCAASFRSIGFAKKFTGAEGTSIIRSLITNTLNKMSPQEVGTVISENQTLFITNEVFNESLKYLAEQKKNKSGIGSYEF